jgi:hypothetical protein
LIILAAACIIEQLLDGKRFLVVAARVQIKYSQKLLLAEFLKVNSLLLLKMRNVKLDLNGSAM